MSLSKCIVLYASNVFQINEKINFAKFYVTYESLRGKTKVDQFIEQGAEETVWT